MQPEMATVRGPIAAGIILDANLYVTMRDGIKLAIDIYRPEKEGSYPVLLSMSPYIKEIQHWPPFLTHSIEAGATSFFVPRGYIHVIAQIRGTGYSQGQYNFFSLKEHQDGYDLIEWIARQNWCNGKVGMMGDSYFAMIQYATAIQQPPHLKCIAPFDGCTDIYRDFTHQGGIFFGWFMGSWGPDMLRQCAWPGPVEGKLPPANIFADLVTHPYDGEYYRERSAIHNIEKIKVPVFSIVAQGGFLHSRGQLAAHAKIKSPKKLMVVPPPGLHAHEFFITNEPFNNYLLRWYDYWLKGIDNGIMDEPPVSICDAVTMEWRYENEYPPLRTQWTHFYFRANPAGKADKPPYGLLSLEPAEREAPDSYPIIESIKLVAANQPVIAFASKPLEKDLKVWGPLSVTLYGSSTTLDTEWFVNLADVSPDGQVNRFTQGHLKASLRELDTAKSRPGQPYHPFRNPVRPEPGKVYEYQIELMPIFHTFKTGHKIWIQISSTDSWYQSFLRTVDISEMVPLPATNIVYHDKEHPSHLLLPVIPDSPPVKTIESPIAEIK
jgi:predicted acyl esterase